MLTISSHLPEHILNEPVKMDHHGEERVRWDTEAFLYKPCLERMNEFLNELVPMHWHEMIEFLYVAQGGLSMTIRNTTFLLQEGEGCLISANEMHSMSTARKGEETIVYNQVFDQNIIAMPDKSIIYMKYIEPFNRCFTVPYFLVSNRTAEGQAVINHINEAFTNGLYMRSGYELVVCAHLCLAWSTLWPELQKAIAHKSHQTYQSQSDDLRIRKILEYIQRNYAERITVDDLSQAANISRRECYRCFRRKLDSSPIVYLQNFRIQKAAIELTSTELPVTDICYNCGFSSVGYFGKMFREIYGVPPTTYRKLMKQEVVSLSDRQHRKEDTEE